MNEVLNELNNEWINKCDANLLLGLHYYAADVWRLVFFFYHSEIIEGNEYNMKTAAIHWLPQVYATVIIIFNSIEDKNVMN